MEVAAHGDVARTAGGRIQRSIVRDRAILGLAYGQALQEEIARDGKR